MVVMNKALIGLAMGLAIAATTRAVAKEEERKPAAPLDLLPRDPVQPPKKGSFAEQRLRDKQRKMERKWRR